jgi:hypothetical protein
MSRRIVCAALLVIAQPTLAHAHGRLPALTQIAFDPTDPQHVVVRGTWAFLTTHDGARSFTWTCATAVGFDRTIEDPPIVVFDSGRLLAGTFNGLSRSDPAGCNYAPVADPSVSGLFVIDIQRDPMSARGGWIASSPGAQANAIIHTPDEGATYETRGTFPMGVLLERVVPSASDAMRVYASGVVLETATTPRHAYVWRSIDGARTFGMTEITLIDVMRTDYGERNVHVDAVDPTNADVVYAHTVRRAMDLMDERLFRSADGGMTFTQVAAMPSIAGVAIGEDGIHVWTGSGQGGFYRSDDRGLTFQPVDMALPVRCLAYRPGELWLCVDNVMASYALGRSTDLGATITPLWHFHDVVDDVGCPACTQVGDVCPGYWPDVEYDLGLPTAADALPPDPDASAHVCVDGALVELDAGLRDAAMDGGPSVSRGGCACAIGRSGDRIAITFALALALLVRARLRHRMRAIVDRHEPIDRHVRVALRRR